MKNLFLAFGLILTSFGFNAQKLVFDASHSQLQFDLVHLKISNLHGGFNKFDSKLEYAKSDFSDAKFSLSADIKSIDTGIDARDNHLKQADFFDAEKHPELKFTTTSFEKGKNNFYTLKGNLELKGVTKPVILNVKFNGSVNNSKSQKVYGFTVTGAIKRSDFGVANSMPDAVVSDVIQLKANLEFVEQK